MRLEAKIKSGFYPLVEDVIPHIANIVSADPKATIFDPCCGKGEAVAKIAEALGISSENVYGCELDSGRSAIARGRIANFVGPVDFLTSPFGTSASIHFVNPPFDDELGGGGRVEWQFLYRIATCASPGSILIAVLPKRTAQSARTHELLNTYYDCLRCIPFPVEAPFEEHLVLGVRSKELNKPYSTPYSEYLRKGLWPDPRSVYRAPKGGRVSVRKNFFTPVELAKELENSKSYEVLGMADKRVIKELVPPMRLTKGHMAMLLASGMLDGVIEPEGEEPHVVRGSTSKVITEKKVEDGTKVQIVRTEQIKLTVKIVDSKGVRTLEDVINNQVEELPPENETEEDEDVAV